MVVEERIMVFRGKKGKYNKLILKTLYESGYLSAWEIARKIADSKRKPRSNWYHEAQKVQSVLIRRKGGRLRELLEKDYIEKADQGYCLTIFKGFCTALTLYKDVVEPSVDPLSKNYELFPEVKEAFEIVSRLHPEAKLEREQYKMMLNISIELLNKGLNFDVVSNRDFNAFFNEQWQLFALQEVKGETKNNTKWETPPEVKRLIDKFLLRTEKIVLQQLKEFQTLRMRYMSSSEREEGMKNE